MREIVVSTVNSGSRCSMCSVRSPLRFGWQRSLSCLHMPEKSGLACAHAVAVIAERTKAFSKIRGLVFFSFPLSLIPSPIHRMRRVLPPPRRVVWQTSEFKPQRELHLARRSRAHRGDRRYDGGVQVDCIDDAAEARCVRRVEGGLRLPQLRVIENVVELRAKF